MNPHGAPPSWNRKRILDQWKALAAKLGWYPRAEDAPYSLLGATRRHIGGMGDVYDLLGWERNKGGRGVHVRSYDPAPEPKEPEREWWRDDFEAARAAFHAKRARELAEVKAGPSYNFHNDQFGKKFRRNRLDRPAEYLPPRDVTTSAAWRAA